jgi:Na+/H+ antiporter NhaD/arsenite permease-like protein
VLVVGFMIAAFFAGQPPAKVALIAGGFMLLTRIVRSERIYREIDWPLLLMFAGLFVVVAGFEKALLTPDVVAGIGQMGFADMGVLSAVTAVLSNLVSTCRLCWSCGPLSAKPATRSTPGSSLRWRRPWRAI